MHQGSQALKSGIRGLIGVILVICGCGGSDDGPPVYPVSGTIRVDGKPASNARIGFHAVNGQDAKAPQPIAIAAKDGSFQPTTRASNDGAPAGEYRLTVAWPEVRIDHGEEVFGPDRLRGKYSNPAQSELKATIKEGENSLPPIELTTKR